METWSHGAPQVQLKAPTTSFTRTTHQAVSTMLPNTLLKNGGEKETLLAINSNVNQFLQNISSIDAVILPRRLKNARQGSKNTDIIA